MYRRLLTLLILLPAFSLQAQETNNVWTLQRCVAFAIEHNISIQQGALNKRLADLTFEQSRLSQLPSVNASTGYGRSYGRSVDPTSNQFVNSNYDFLSVNGNADVLLFGWFQRRNAIKRNDLNAQASAADLDQLKDDVSLNVATGYLRALLAKEQIVVNEHQVALSAAQLAQTKRFADAGRIPELQVAQLESQLAGDSSNLITAQTDYISAILDIKALLNLDLQTPFDVTMPDVPTDNAAELLSHSPEEIFTVASQRFGAIKSGQLKVDAAVKNVAVARGALWPQLSFSAQVGTNYATTTKDYSLTSTDYILSGNYVDVGGFHFPIYEPSYNYTTTTSPLNNQLGDNIRSTYSLNLNIPLFNGWQGQAAVRQASIQVEQERLSKYQSELKLKQDIYKAYSDAQSALQKFAAAQRANDAATRALGFAQRRYELGLTNTVEYLITQNSQYTAASNLGSARYDLVFRLKVLDYYLGREIKL